MTLLARTLQSPNFKKIFTEQKKEKRAAMEGLIPLILQSLKKQRPSQQSFRCLSDSSNRSYHLLMGAPDSFDGSSHRRTRLEFQTPPPTTVDSLDHHHHPHRSALELNRGSSVLASPPSTANGSRQTGFSNNFRP
ncbi:unnamed protein product [Camellia sinensis]